MELTVASERSEIEIQQHADSERVKHSLRQLAANMLRIVRGAGSPKLARQMGDCVDAFEAYRASHGSYPPFQSIQEYLDPDKTTSENRPWSLPDTQQLIRWEADGSVDRKFALQEIRSGALQLAASQLVDQLTHEARGKHELLDGVRAYIAAQEKGREYHRSELKRTTTTGRRKRPKTVKWK